MLVRRLSLIDQDWVRATVRVGLGLCKLASFDEFGLGVGSQSGNR